MQLALLALALPTAALASTISFSTGTTDTIGSLSLPVLTGCCFNAQVSGPPYTINFSNAIVTTRFPNGGLFTGGTVTVINNTTDTTVFHSSIATGSFSFSQFCECYFGEATLEPSATIESGTAVFLIAFGANAANVVSSASVTATTTIPETSTLLSFGTGLVALAVMMRRKLRLGS
jgi:hypothetical protein